MSDDGSVSGWSIKRHPEVPHYHGDETRGLFVLSAIMLIVAQSTGAELPLSTTGAVVGAAVLVIAAGITNPMQHGIHWFNALLAVTGTLIFGISAVEHYRAGVHIFDFVFVEALALLSLIALYLTTKTIRGLSTSLYPPH